MMADCHQIDGCRLAGCWLCASNGLAGRCHSAGCMPFPKYMVEFQLKTLLFSAACKALHGVR